MVERYSLKFTPAVSHKDLMKHFQEGKGFDEAQLAKLHQMKARIELLCDPADLKKIDELLKLLSEPESGKV
jgi:hypothetical protein